jgi:VanZ family protein
VALTGLVAAYLCAAWYPFRWQPPRRIVNGAEVLADGTLRFPTVGLARTRAPASWLAAAARQGAFTLRLQARSFSPSQSGPARIFSVSANPRLRNVTLAQQGPHLVCRLRTPATSLNGVPAMEVPGVFADDQWRTIELRVTPGSAKLLVDGRLRVRTEIAERALDTWGSGYHAALGNELTADRPWLGVVSAASVSVDRETVDYLQPSVTALPRRLWPGVTIESFQDLPLLREQPARLLDLTLNFLGFGVLGYLLAGLAPPQRALLATIVLGALLSLAVECTQLCFEGRVPSLNDWLANTAGAACGALAGGRRPRWLGNPPRAQTAAPRF